MNCWIKWQMMLMMVCSAVPDLGLHYLLRPVCPITQTDPN